MLRSDRVQGRYAIFCFITHKHIASRLALRDRPNAHVEVAWYIGIETPQRHSPS
jgi:hypothetical protein